MQYIYIQEIALEFEKYRRYFSNFFIVFYFFGQSNHFSITVMSNWPNI